MNAEFNWWLLIVGLVVGAGLVWLVIADWSRREDDLTEQERSAESAWISEVMRERGEAVDPDAAETILALHRAYLHQTGALDSLDESFYEHDVDEVDWPDEEANPTPDWNLERDGLNRLGPRPEQDSQPSVRSTPLSPRGGPARGLESEPPQA